MGMDLDDIFSYTTSRKLVVRDRYLGLTLIAAKIGILAYVLVYQVILQQAYMRVGDIAGVTRMSLRRPGVAYRWNGEAPYCKGVNESESANYQIRPNNVYRYISDDGSFSLDQPQGDCLYLDNKYAVTTSDAEVSAFFLPTRITVTQEVIAPWENCTRMQTANCDWVTTATNLTYVADVSMFTLMIDHSFTSSIGLSYNVRDMQGMLLDQKGNEMNPCDDYAGFVNCPTFITSGGSGKPSIFSMQTLLRAAGRESLDMPMSNRAPLNAESMRYAGFVMVIDIQYTNYYLPTKNAGFGTQTFDSDTVKFAYKVNIVPEQDFKTEQVVPATADKFAPSRIGYNQHGFRIIVTQSGNIGKFDFQTLLINLTVSLGLLSVATIITDFVAFNVCTGKQIYRQYQVRRTVDMSDVRATGRMKEILESFKENPDLVDPVPPVLQEALDTRAQLQAERKAALEANQKGGAIAHAHDAATAVPLDPKAVPFALVTPIPHKPRAGHSQV